jgi:hypothetical protein
MYRVLFFLLLTLAALAAPPAQVWKPEEVMVLIVGPTSNPISTAESDVVSRLAELRSQYQLSKLKMATMHWDRPGEADYARKVLNVTAADLPAVAVVQLDKKGMPVKKLYVMPRVDRTSLESIDKVVKLWAGFTGVTVTAVPKPKASPAAVRPAATPSPALGGPAPTGPRPTGPNYSTDGMLTMARLTDDLTQSIVARQKDLPLRPDQRDQPARQALLNLSENTRQLRQAFETRNGNPQEQLRQVLRRKQEFRTTQPDVYLPTVVRSDTRRLFDLLDQLEVIYYQLNPK